VDACADPDAEADPEAEPDALADDVLVDAAPDALVAGDSEVGAVAVPHAAITSDNSTNKLMCAPIRFRRIVSLRERFSMPIGIAEGRCAAMPACVSPSFFVHKCCMNRDNAVDVSLAIAPLSAS
jgi:hypothetical protein